MSVMYRLVCVDCAAEVWLGDIHPDTKISEKVNVIVPDALSTSNRLREDNTRIAELGYFLVQHSSHRLTFVNEFALAKIGLHGELEDIGSLEYLVHLADIEGKSKSEVFEKASIFPAELELPKGSETT